MNPFSLDYGQVHSKNLLRILTKQSISTKSEEEPNLESKYFAASAEGATDYAQQAMKRWSKKDRIG